MAAGRSAGVADTAASDASSSPLRAVRLVLLMGLPASGKTTVARDLQLHQHQHTTRDAVDLVVHHICVDELYNATIAEKPPHSARPLLSSQSVAVAVSPAFSPAVWHHSRSLAFANTRRLLAELLSSRPDALSASSAPPLHLLLVDDVLHLRSMRRVYYRLCRQLQVPFTQLMLDTPLHVCIERHQQRSAAVSTSGSPSASHSSLTAAIIASLHAAFQRPSASELPYSIILASSPSTVLQRDELLSLIRGVYTLPPPAVEDEARNQAAEQQQLQSAVHLLDIAMRRRIGERMQASAAAAQAGAAERLALSLNAVRRSVLREARQAGSLVSELLKPDGPREEDEQAAGLDGRLAGKEAAAQLDARLSRVLDYFTQLLDAL